VVRTALSRGRIGSMQHRIHVMSEMALAIAHELNQPLCAITSSAESLVRMIDGSHPGGDGLLRAAKLISAQSHLAADIIKRIRSFTQKEEPEQVPVDINTIVRAAADLNRMDPVQGQLALSLADGLPLVLGDAIQLEQVVLNLLRNGREASSNVEQSRLVLTVRTRSAHKGVEVAVEDTGCGLSSDIVDRVFDPFFTTKPNGMGLGLAICRSILETHGGRLWATSAPGGGTVFRFFLPAVDGAHQDEQ